MRTRIVVLALTGVLAGTACASSGAVRAHPALKFAGGKALKGQSFTPREVVRLSFTGPAFRRQRQLKTDATGAFVASLPAYDPCVGPLLVLARGASGDQARLKLPQRACPPPAQSQS